MDFGIKSIEEPRNKHGKENVNKISTSKLSPPMNSLIHPDWELADPNPNIYDLFQVFDNRFFWNKLGSVEVKWSPRMTSCAGVCTYKGRAGCVISLSSPLLKLRPRKDLIETLLHEMIHAYLFITKNFKDRSDHGPEFHKHMYRINAEGGTKITVYHSFHDEVHYYQTHWWRCDGPCQHRRPYFGLVKRSMNRAPGPSDFWFAEHQSTCGGTFTKIKEPEGYKSKKRKKNPKDEDNSVKKEGPKADITKYIQSQNPGTSGQFTNSKDNIDVSTSGGSIKNSPGYKTQTTNPVGAPAFKPSGSTSHFPYTLTQLKTKMDNIIADSRMKNVHGFQTLAQPSNPVGTYQMPPSSSKLTGSRGGLGVATNTGSSTIIVHSTVKTNFVPFAGSGFKLGAGESNTAVKSRQKNNPKKQIKTDRPQVHQIRIEDSDSDGELNSDSIISCPVCNRSIHLRNIESHLEECKKLDSGFYNTIIIDSDNETETAGKPNSVKCPCCATLVNENKINEHLDICLQ